MESHNLAEAIEQNPPIEMARNWLWKAGSSEPSEGGSAFDADWGKETGSLE
jgi:hypothetical protein